jgi:hypothetical protein
VGGLVTPQPWAFLGVAVFDVDGPPGTGPVGHLLPAVSAAPGQARPAAAAQVFHRVLGSPV